MAARKDGAMTTTRRWTLQDIPWDRFDAAKVNPMELWDLHALRRIDDSGFIDRLYKGASRAAGTGAR